MAETETIMLRGIPPRLKGKIKRRVETEGTNMNDVLVAILADTYGVPFTPTGARRLEVGMSEQILLSVPSELKRAIAVEAADASDHIRNVAVKIISEAFGVAFVATGRRAGAVGGRPKPKKKKAARA